MKRVLVVTLAAVAAICLLGIVAIGEEPSDPAQELVYLRAQVKLLEAQVARLQAELAEARGQGPASRPARTERCYYCRGSGLMACQECTLRGEPTGRGPCPQCHMTGRVDCSGCRGRWNSGPCIHCAGRGYSESRELIPATKVTRIVRNACGYCKGSGYAGLCPVCGVDSHIPRGKMRCPACNGSQRSGVCATCNGTKKTPCKRCPPATHPASTQPNS